MWTTNLRLELAFPWDRFTLLFMLGVSLLLAGLVASDRNVVRYAIPLAAIGLLVTLYHCLVFFGLIPENMRPCSQGVSCSDSGMVLAGFLPIPLLSLAAFLIVFVLLLILQSRKSS